jgi:hypothetical protein
VTRGAHWPGPPAAQHDVHASIPPATREHATHEHADSGPDNSPRPDGPYSRGAYPYIAGAPASSGPPPTPRHDASKWRGGDGPPVTRGAHWPGPPRPPPAQRDVHASIPPATREHADSGPDNSPRSEGPYARGADPYIAGAPASSGPPPTPRRDASRSRGDDGPSVTRGAHSSGPPMQPDVHASIPPTTHEHADSSPDNITPKSACASCATGRESGGEVASHHSEGVTGPAPPQPGTGYKVLPKSYWSGAAWRWRQRSDQDTQ